MSKPGDRFEPPGHWQPEVAGLMADMNAMDAKLRLQRKFTYRYRRLTAMAASAVVLLPVAGTEKLENMVPFGGRYEHRAQALRNCLDLVRSSSRAGANIATVQLANQTIGQVKACGFENLPNGITDAIEGLPGLLQGAVGGAQEEVKVNVQKTISRLETEEHRANAIGEDLNFVDRSMAALAGLEIGIGAVAGIGYFKKRREELQIYWPARPGVRNI